MKNFRSVGGMKSVLINDQQTIITVRTSREVQSHYGINEKTLSYWRANGRGPEYFMIGRWVFYADIKIEEWLKARKEKNAIKACELPIGAISDPKRGKSETVDALFPGKVFTAPGEVQDFLEKQKPVASNPIPVDRRGPVARFFGRFFLLGEVNHGKR